MLQLQRAGAQLGCALAAPLRLSQLVAVLWGFVLPETGGWTGLTVWQFEGNGSRGPEHVLMRREGVYVAPAVTALPLLRTSQRQSASQQHDGASGCLLVRQQMGQQAASIPLPSTCTGKDNGWKRQVHVEQSHNALLVWSVVRSQPQISEGEAGATTTNSHSAVA
mmetsp:Transcript_6094/g.11358  ORF Transcript_6094/g.11358 Transcript_6094/m.11358 type:complete len:165 (-) Transcript_6094:292-786(-)